MRLFLTGSRSRDAVRRPSGTSRRRYPQFPGLPRVGLVGTAVVIVIALLGVCLVGVPVIGAGVAAASTRPAAGAANLPVPTSNRASSVASSMVGMPFGARAARAPAVGSSTGVASGVSVAAGRGERLPPGPSTASPSAPAGHAAPALSALPSDTFPSPDFTALAPGGSFPPARTYPFAVFDSAHNQDVLFGGYGQSGFLGDTWLFNGTTWSNPGTPTAPSARDGA